MTSWVPSAREGRLRAFALRPVGALVVACALVQGRRRQHLEHGCCGVQLQLQHLCSTLCCMHPVPTNASAGLPGSAEATLWVGCRQPIPLVLWPTVEKVTCMRRTASPRAWPIEPTGPCVRCKLANSVCACRKDPPHPACPKQTSATTSIIHFTPLRCPLSKPSSVPFLNPQTACCQVSQRFLNSHSILNAALSFQRLAPDGALSKVRVVVGCFDTPDVGARCENRTCGGCVKTHVNAEPEDTTAPVLLVSTVLMTLLLAVLMLLSEIEPVQ